MWAKSPCSRGYFWKKWLWKHSVFAKNGLELKFLSWICIDNIPVFLGLKFCFLLFGYNNRVNLASKTGKSDKNCHETIVIFDDYFTIVNKVYHHTIVFLTSVFFSPWTSKVPVNLVFWRMFTGTYLGSRALFKESSRASGCVHGHFFGPFHGHFFEVHGQKKQNVHGHFLMFTGIFWFSKFYVHGHFSMFTGTFAKKNEISFDKRKIKGLMFSWIFLNP